jgi:EmrB/QacA subfamily drug resistance transporter
MSHTATTTQSIEVQPHGPEHHHAEFNHGRRPWAILVLLAVAQFMAILDVTVVNVALPSIGEALSFSASQLQWVVTAYVLFTGGLMLLGGRLADLTGRKTIFLAGLGVFTTASLASGLAWSPGVLIVTRALQGAGAALLLPSALSIVTTTYSGHQRAIALGVWGALGSAGAAAGVLLGGVITTLLSWKWVFFINVPVGLLVGLLATRVIPSAPRSGRGRGQLDLLGGATLVTGLIGLVLAIQGTSSHGWTSTRTLLLAAVAAALLAGFAAIERAGRRPLVPPTTWRIRSLVSSATVMLAATGILVGAFFLNTLYLQRVLGDSALETGLAFLPLTLVILVGAHVASRLLPSTGSRPLMAAGLAIMAAGAFLLSGVPDHASYAADLLPGFLALGFGVGLTFVSVSVAAMADVRHDNAGLASGLMTTAHELGAAIGVAVLSAVATGGAKAASVPGLVTGYGDAFLVAAAVATGAALIAALAVPSVRPAPGTSHAMH